MAGVRIAVLTSELVARTMQAVPATSIAGTVRGTGVAATPHNVLKGSVIYDICVRQEGKSRSREQIPSSLKNVVYESQDAFSLSKTSNLIASSWPPCSIVNVNSRDWPRPQRGSKP